MRRFVNILNATVYPLFHLVFTAAALCLYSRDGLKHEMDQYTPAQRRFNEYMIGGLVISLLAIAVHTIVRNF